MTTLRDCSVVPLAVTMSTNTRCKLAVSPDVTSTLVIGRTSKQTARGDSERELLA